MGSRSRYVAKKRRSPLDPKRPGVLVRRANMAHGKSLTYSQAEGKAQKHFGPNGAVRFFKPPKGRPTYHVGVIFVDKVDGVEQKLFGVLGQGGSWRIALADAFAHVRRETRRLAKEAQAAEDAGNGAPSLTEAP